MQKIMTGKVKEVYEVDDDTLEFAYTDNISVFDKIIPSKIPHKGETLCRTAKYWFGKLNEAGIHNHYISEPSKDRMRVKRVNVIRDYSKIDGTTTNYLIPLEVICRYYAAGSLLDRLKALRRVHHQAGGARREPDRGRGQGDGRAQRRRVPGDRGHRPQDRPDHRGGGRQARTHPLRRQEGVRIRQGEEAHGREEYAKGNIVELSKEFVRQYYRETGYHDELYAARDAGKPEPDIPALPQDIIDRVSKLYVDMYERITGEKF